jgi:RNA polymerase sigma factor (sigma-70 family)
MKAGAVDFIEKPFEEQRLLDAVHEALALDARRQEQDAARVQIRRRLDTLTPREREVMTLVVQGRHNKVIAQQLGISQRTVESHRGKVMAKMRAASVPELVRTIVRLDG